MNDLVGVELPLKEGGDLRQVSQLKTIIKEIDEDAFVTVSGVHEVMGGRFKKRAIH